VTAFSKILEHVLYLQISLHVVEGIQIFTCCAFLPVAFSNLLPVGLSTPEAVQILQTLILCYRLDTPTIHVVKGRHHQITVHNHGLLMPILILCTPG
jgi:hypothetical protein